MCGGPLLSEPQSPHRPHRRRRASSVCSGSRRLRPEHVCLSDWYRLELDRENEKQQYTLKLRISLIGAKTRKLDAAQGPAA